jgi:kynureninase
VMRTVFEYLMKNGVIGDERETANVIRLAPTPLYNTLKDCEQAVAVLEQ